MNAKVVGAAGFIMSTLEKFPPNANPHQYDVCRMGQSIGTTVEIMYDHHDVNDYIVVVHKPSGKRVRITMPGVEIAQIELHGGPRVEDDDVADKYEACSRQGKALLAQDKLTPFVRDSIRVGEDNYSWVR
jgi:hypothetical protein